MDMENRAAEKLSQVRDDDLGGQEWGGGWKSENEKARLFKVESGPKGWR